MAANSTAKSSAKSIAALRILSAIAAHEPDFAAALADLNDKQLLTLVNKSFKTPHDLKKATTTAHNLAAIFKRIATLLLAEDSDALVARAGQRARRRRVALD